MFPGLVLPLRELFTQGWEGGAHRQSLGICSFFNSPSQPARYPGPLRDVACRASCKAHLPLKEGVTRDASDKAHLPGRQSKGVHILQAH